MDHDDEDTRDGSTGTVRAAVITTYGTIRAALIDRRTALLVAMIGAVATIGPQVMADDLTGVKRDGAPMTTRPPADASPSTTLNGTTTQPPPRATPGQGDPEAGDPSPGGGGSVAPVPSTTTSLTSTTTSTAPPMPAPAPSAPAQPAPAPPAPAPAPPAQPAPAPAPPAPRPAPPPPPPVTGTHQICGVEDATIRPTPGGEPIATLYRGDYFNPSGRREGVWSHGQTPDGRHVGWVGTTYLCRV